MNFEISSSFSPTGDQPEAIAALSEGIKSGVPFQTLLGVTGSGKTFTIANVIKEVQRPTLILSHNKTLAAQLYSEFKAFFPNNAVEYFVSFMIITNRRNTSCPGWTSGVPIRNKAWSRASIPSGLPSWNETR